MTTMEELEKRIVQLEADVIRYKQGLEDAEYLMRAGASQRDAYNAVQRALHGPAFIYQRGPAAAEEDEA